MAESGQYSRSVLAGSDSYSDEMKDIYCEPCHKDGQVAIAEGYCVDCPEYLCAQCYKSHRRNKILANHVLLDKDSMPIAPDYSRGVLDVCEEKCPSHPSKVTDFFCENCQKLGCHICVTLNHRQCEKVKHIPDIVKDLDNDKELEWFNEDIESTAYELSQHEEQLNANVTSNNEMRKLAKQELVRQRAEINKFLDKLEKKMDDQITAIEKRNKKTLKTASDRLDQMKKESDQIKNDVNAKIKEHKCELFIAMKRGKEKMMTDDDQLKNLRGELRIQHYTLLPSEQIEAMMRTTTEICSIATARLESVIDVKTSTDKEPFTSIHGLTIMHGHYCVVADNHNNSIKVIDTNSKCVISEISIEVDYIGSLTSVSDDQVAVSVSLSDQKQHQIQFFSVTSSGVIQSTNQQYEVDTIYLNMVHCKGHIYGPKNGKIHMLNMTGKVVRTFQTLEKGFFILGGMALSNDGETLYVVCGQSGKESVTSMTLDGKVKAVYKDKDLVRPQGITVDKHGYIYVRSSSTYNIQQLTADFNKVQVLIDDVNAIGDITYSSNEHKLYVSDRDKVIQFSLDSK